MTESYSLRCQEVLSEEVAVMPKNRHSYSAVERSAVEHVLLRERDIAAVRSGKASAAEVGRKNGAFGHAAAERGGINWRRVGKVS